MHPPPSNLKEALSVATERESAYRVLEMSGLRSKLDLSVEHKISLMSMEGAKV